MKISSATVIDLCFPFPFVLRAEVCVAVMIFSPSLFLSLSPIIEGFPDTYFCQMLHSSSGEAAAAAGTPALHFSPLSGGCQIAFFACPLLNFSIDVKRGPQCVWVSQYRNREQM